ncbi:unnamed protein product [Ambrosiozyma monospora]|uniref:Unnamed protein product n=1 Tax=Ambrosiozyma monospora TaxID=43982 RepID=A0ACB5SS94_AMBMO|nr:unnamed protein product [Ambrosiozyma monospora]
MSDKPKSEIISETKSHNSESSSVSDLNQKLDQEEQLAGLAPKIQAKFDEFEQLAEESKHNKTLWDRVLLDTGFKVSFKNKVHMSYMLAAFASIGGMLSGADQSLISGATVFLEQDFHLTSHEQSLVSSLVAIGAIAGAILISPLNQLFGRRFSIMISCVSYTIGGIICAAAQTVHQLYTGRFFIGIGIGLESIIPAYVSECSPRHIRGNLTSLFQFNIALGEVFGYAIAAMFYNLKGAWRYILGSSLFFSTLLLTGMFFLPESPRYLVVIQKKTGAAYRIWKTLRNMDDLDNKLEFLELVESTRFTEQSGTHETRKHLWMDFFTVPRARRSIIYAFIMIFLGQFTGVNAVMYDSSYLMDG